MNRANSANRSHLVFRPWHFLDKKPFRLLLIIRSNFWPFMISDFRSHAIRPFLLFILYLIWFLWLPTLDHFGLPVFRFVVFSVIRPSFRSMAFSIIPPFLIRSFGLFRFRPRHFWPLDLSSISAFTFRPLDHTALWPFQLFVLSIIRFVWFGPFSHSVLWLFL